MHLDVTLERGRVNALATYRGKQYVYRGNLDGLIRFVRALEFYLDHDSSLPQ
jgi:hypothetical protein